MGFLFYSGYSFSNSETEVQARFREELRQALSFFLEPGHMENLSASEQSQRDHYKSAGVDIGKADSLARWLGKDLSKQTHCPHGELVSGIGGFASLFRPDFTGLQDPLLVSATDGVGTKLLLGLETGLTQGLGKDLVAMCVNDLYTLGAEPLFFLDYYASGSLCKDTFQHILSSIRDGLQECQAILIGGETAELPGLYQGKHFDLAGFVVGMADGTNMPNPDLVREGDKLISLPSSGFHSNGYSLIRKWLKVHPELLTPDFAEYLMRPTKIYFELPALWQQCGPEKIHGIAHITGGGLTGNLPRVIPDHLSCLVHLPSMQTPPPMESLWSHQGISRESLLDTFNMGTGMVLLVSRDAEDYVCSAVKKLGLTPAMIGQVVRRKPGSSGIEYES